jgi:hypothetical protein
MLVVTDPVKLRAFDVIIPVNDQTYIIGKVSPINYYMNFFFQWYGKNRRRFKVMGENPLYFPFAVSAL